MAKVEINVEKMKEVGDELLTIVGDYNKSITDLYTKISKIEENGIWVSSTDRGASRQFIEATLKDQEPAQNLGENIKGVSSKIKTYATRIQQLADPNATGESYSIAVDTEAISNTIIPEAKKEVESIRNALSIATSTSSPDGDNSWSSIIGELRECEREASNYYNRMVEMNDGLINVMTTMPEEIAAMSIVDIPKKITVVK